MNERKGYHGAEGFVEFLPSIMWEHAPEGATVVVWSSTQKAAGTYAHLRSNFSINAAAVFAKSARDLFTQGEEITVLLLSENVEDRKILAGVMDAVARSAVYFGGCPGEMESDADEMAASISLPIRFPIPPS